METPKQYRFGIGDAYHFLMWVSETYPQIFNEWKCIRAIEPEPEIEIKETTWD